MGPELLHSLWAPTWLWCRSMDYNLNSRKPRKCWPQWVWSRDTESMSFIGINLSPVQLLYGSSYIVIINGRFSDHIIITVDRIYQEVVCQDFALFHLLFLTALWSRWFLFFCFLCPYCVYEETKTWKRLSNWSLVIKLETKSVGLQRLNTKTLEYWQLLSLHRFFLKKNDLFEISLSSRIDIQQWILCADYYSTPNTCPRHAKFVPTITHNRVLVDFILFEMKHFFSQLNVLLSSKYNLSSFKIFPSHFWSWQ